MAKVLLFDYFCIFIITQHNSEPYVWKSSAKDLEQLEDWNLEYLESYHAPREAKTEAEKQKLQKCWETSMGVHLKQLAKILQIDRIIKKIPEKYNRLILIPHLYLHLFPLHALPINNQQGEAKSEILMHRFPAGISYAPSCQLLELAQTRKRPDFAQGYDTPVKDANNLWLKCQEIGKKLGIPKLESLPEIIKKDNSQASNINGQILSQQILTFSAIEHKAHRHLSGEVNPLQIHDTYALDLTLRYSSPEVQIADLNGLNLDKCLLPSHIKASLGQTLVLFTQPVGDIQDEQAFADACVKALLSVETVNELRIYCQSQGKLLGSPIYEYNNDADFPLEQCHILIWLNTNSQTTQRENNGDYYYPLIDLLNSRSKIIYARSQAIWCYHQARKEYSKLETIVIEFNKVKNQPTNSKLKSFNQWLTQMSEISVNYARNLRDLKLHKTTIQTNSANYRSSLDRINKIGIKDDNLEFLSKFLELVEGTFVEQINTDIEYLTPGQNFFDKMINTIRGIVEIEQAEIDRALETALRDKDKAAEQREERIEHLIALVGTGLTVTGISSQSPGKPVESIIALDCPKAGFTPCLTYSSFFVIFHVFVGAIAALILWLIIRLLSKSKTTDN
ncbi:MAG: hypothetical protein WBA07_14080 [Rivularia sp. (in: cyanobacteria)]